MSRRPNVIVYLTDDQRFDQMGNMNALIKTPEMDTLASEGVRFDRAFVTSPICAASRASILTGVVERTHRFTFETPPLATHHVANSFAAKARQAGYRTGHIGKFGVDVHPGATDMLFDSLVELGLPYWQELDGIPTHLTDLEAQRAVDFLAELDPDTPFCLTVSFNAPHAEDEAPEQYFAQPDIERMYEDVKVPPVPLVDPSIYAHLPAYLRDGTENRARWHWRFDSEPKRQRMTKGYWAMISGVDAAIGRIRHTLADLGLASNTVSFLIGDNGMFLGERGFADKWLPYEESIHVPLLMHDPTGRYARRGLQIPEIALNIDLAPTILDVIGVDVPDVMQGRSLVPLATGQHPPWRADTWLEHLYRRPTIRKWEGVRGDRYKYARYFEAVPLLEQLFDLVEDPLETTNLINLPDHQPTVAALRARTDELRGRLGGPYDAAAWMRPTS